MDADGEENVKILIVAYLKL